MITLLKRRRLALVLLIAFVFSCFVQANTALSPAERAASIEGVSRILNEKYVFPDTALKVSALLQQQEQKGALADITNQEQFVAKIGALMRQHSGAGSPPPLDRARRGRGVDSMARCVSPLASPSST